MLEYNICVISEMSNFPPDITGLKYPIWIDESGKDRNVEHNIPRLKVKVNKQNKKGIPVSIDKDNPVILAKNQSIPEFLLIQDYIKCEYDNLINVWNKVQLVSEYKSLLKSKKKSISESVTRAIKILLKTYSDERVEATDNYTLDINIYTVTLYNKPCLLFVKNRSNYSTYIVFDKDYNEVDRQGVILESDLKDILDFISDNKDILLRYLEYIQDIHNIHLRMKGSKS